MPAALGVIEFGSIERCAIVWQSEIFSDDRSELLHEFLAPLGDSGRQLRLMVREVEERCAGGEFLSLKKHRRIWTEEQKRSQRANAAGGGELLNSPPGRRVRDLIVILQKADEFFRSEIERRCSSPQLLPGVALALKEKSMFCQRHEFLPLAAVVGVVSLAPAGDGHRGGMVPVVVPEGVDPVLPDDVGVLRLVLGDDENSSLASGFARPALNQRHDVFRRAIVNALSGVESKSVEMELVDPVARIFGEKLAHAGDLEVDRLSPFVGFVCEKTGREFFPVAAVGAEMVVDHVEDDAQVEGVSSVDEGAEIVGRAVQARGRPQVDSVVTPAEAARKFVDRHHLDQIDSDLRDRREIFGGRAPRPFARERADVHLVDDQIAGIDAAPSIIAPSVRLWIDNFGRTMRTVGLESRGRIGKSLAVFIQPVAIARSRSDPSNKSSEVSVAFSLERSVGALDDDADAFSVGRPDSKIDTLAREEFSTNRPPARQGHVTTLSQ